MTNLSNIILCITRSLRQIYGRDFTNFRARQVRQRRGVRDIFASANDVLCTSNRRCRNKCHIIYLPHTISNIYIPIRKVPDTMYSTAMTQLYRKYTYLYMFPVFLADTIFMQKMRDINVAFKKQHFTRHLFI